MLRIVALGLCLCGIADPALARALKHGETGPCDVSLPPLREATVTYDVTLASRDGLERACNPNNVVAYGSALACSFPQSDDHWSVYVLNTVSLDDLSCLVKYEVAHMPPNYWGDPEIETKRAIDWLSAQKSAAR